MRLTFPEESRWKAPLPWTTTRSQLPPSSDGWTFPAVFSIAGRTAQQMFIEFGGLFPIVAPLARDYRIRIEVKVVHRKRWIQLVTFTLRAWHVTDPERYIAYSNSAHDLDRTPVVGPRAMRVRGGWWSRIWRSRLGSGNRGRCGVGGCCTRSASPRPAPEPPAGW
jgi:hypothetical protein